MTPLILIAVSTATNLAFLESTYIINSTSRLQAGAKYTKTIFQVYIKIFTLALKGYVFQSYISKSRIALKIKEEI